LVPFGEYIPLRPILGWLDKLVPIGGDFQRGTEARPLLVPVRSGQVRVGVLICYEDIFPEFARESALAGAEMLAVLTNDAWFGEGGAAYQHAASSVLRAVETRRPVLRCGNSGWSGWIDEFGNIRATLLNEKGSIYFRGYQTLDVTRDLRWRSTVIGFYCSALGGLSPVITWCLICVRRVYRRMGWRLFDGQERAVGGRRRIAGL